MIERRPARWIQFFIDHGAAVLLVCFILLSISAFLSGAWSAADTTAVAMGIVVALAQVLLVYKLVEPTLDEIREIKRGRNWTPAVREFLALCSMSARDLSRGLAYHIEDNGNGIIVLRQGISEVLNDISSHAQAFDTMARHCSNAFSDDDLAKLSQISADLRSCATNATSAAKRLQVLDENIKPFVALAEDEIAENTYRRADLSLYAEGEDRQRCWLVRDIDEIFEPMIEACVRMRELVEQSSFAKPVPEQFIEGSERYKRAINKQKRSLAEADEEERRKIEADIEQDMRFASHFKLLDRSVGELRSYNEKIEAHGLCIAWLPDEPPREPSGDDEIRLRA